MIIQYAVMIDTRTEGTDAAIGLYDGSLCWISGDNLELDGGSLPENPMTESAQTVWKRGILSESVMGMLSEAFDFLAGGGYSTRAGAEISVMNNIEGLNATLFDYLIANEVDLLRTRARTFVVLEGVFHERGTFMIEDMENQEHAITFQFVDSFLIIHGAALKVEITRDSFPAALDGLIGRFLPVTMGRMPEAHGIRIASGINSITLQSPDAKVSRIDRGPGTELGANRVRIFPRALILGLGAVRESLQEPCFE